MKTFECMRTFEGYEDIVLSLNYDESLLASGCADGTIRVWNMCGVGFVLRGHTDWVNKVLIHQKNRLFSCSDDHSVKL
jgi:WD40 repeat protein